MPSAAAATGLAARTLRGLEWVGAEEIAGRVPDVAGIEMVTRQVNFTVVGSAALRAALELRTVDDVLVRVATVRGVGVDRRMPAALAGAVARMDVGPAIAAIRAVRPLPDGPMLDVVASLDGDRSFTRYDVEDAVGGALAPVLGTGYASRREGAVGPSSLSVRVVLRGDRAEVMVRLAARPLHRRPWKLHTGVGTLHPPAAAALLRMAGPAGWMADPCCGDGTFVVEAARNGAAPLSFGADLDAGRVRNARRNAAAAGADVALVVADAAAAAWRPPGPGGLVATNPPWSRTVGGAGSLASSLRPLWRSAATLLGGEGRLALVVDADIDPSDDLRALGFEPVVTQQIRLVGRVVRLTVVALGGAGDPPSIWRDRSIREGITTPAGF